ncbi:H-NS histone family protein [Tatumella sp. JGM130]|uniref:H-NS histone family protein n=1 Tax=Tatumella sp. JGM130 TaxID=2799797 RepID=UPI001BB05505|nr:H-NS family nucleoid-associated regulatory protein [Tatumella sp. JGM130]MBS0895215.1 H-NS histone family protein [Tatumella sp. JGM130]
MTADVVVNQLNSILSRLSFEEFSNSKNQLKDLIDSYELKFIEQEEKKKQKEEALSKIREIVSATSLEGITAEDLEENDPLRLILALPEAGKKGKKTRAPKKPKYAYTDETGTEKTWSGQGRTPLFLANYKEQHGSIDKFLIENNDQEKSENIELP